MVAWKRAGLRPSRGGRGVRICRGDQGVLLLPRRRADPLVPEIPLQIPAGGLPLRRSRRHQPGTEPHGLLMHLDQILLAIFILLTVAALSTALSTYIGLGSILGLLVTGVIVGPSGLAITHRVTELRHVSELGVVLLLFVIGLEMQPEKLWSLRRVVFGLGSLQVVVTGLALAAYASLTIEYWQGAVILGLGLALSSTAFVVQILEERGDLATEYGTTAFG